MFDASLAPRAPTIQERLSVPNRYSNLNNTISGFGQMQTDKYQAGQQLQLAQAQQLANAQAMYMAYTGKRNPNIDAMLSNNPYGKFIIPQGQGLSSANQPQTQNGNQPMNNQVAGTLFGLPPAQAMAASGNMPMSYGNPSTNTDTSSGSVPSNGQSMSLMNPISGPVQTSMTSEMQPYVGMVPKSITTQNPQGEAAVQSAKSQAEAGVAVPEQYSKDIMSSKAKEDVAAGTLYGLSKNLIADLKASQVESGGGGPVMGRLANLDTMFGGSPATFGIKNTVRDTAIAYARNLSGGSQGVTRLFQNIVDTIPNENATSKQAGTASLQMYLTARQLQSGMDNLNLTPPDLKNMTDDQLQNVLGSGNIDRNSEAKKFAQVVANTPATKILDMNGKLSEAEPNMFTRMLKNKPSSQSDSKPQKTSDHFVEGETYIDAKGNKATYKNGQFVEVK